MQDQLPYLVRETIDIGTDLLRLRRMNGLDGINIVRLAMREAVAANRAAIRLIGTGGLDLNSKMFRRTVNALDRRALRITALEAALDRYPPIAEALTAARIKARRAVKEAA